MEPIEKLYVEASTLCNLNCTMCMRRGWNGEPMGHMDMELYKKLIDEAATTKSIRTVFFGGIGEPMYHPQFIEMVSMAKATGKRVECVSNGTLMPPERAKEIIEAGLDQVWFSIDGFDEKTYEDIREQGSFAELKRNIMHVAQLRTDPRYAHFRIGLTFVVMRDNVHQLMDLMTFAWRCGASDVKISNVLPYNEENMQQALYWRALKNGQFAFNNADLEPNTEDTEDGIVLGTHVDIPFMDINDKTVGPLSRVLNSSNTFSIMGEPLRRKTGHCRFIQENNVFVKWNGEVSPCMALLHPSETFLHNIHRSIKPKSFGNIADNTLLEIWTSEPYAAFRDLVRRFDFSYCMMCGGCHRIETNDEDCFGNAHPTCGACLWAQGFIQCP
jgi:MoaA/NifB/PqqE/SkfB family radical SAM enzyme